MTSFHNKRKVINEAGEQNVYGDMNFYIEGDSSAGHTKRSRNDADPYGSLDKEILTALAFPQMTDRRRSIGNPLRQTCTWIFQNEKYQRWSGQLSGLLWIKGKPGAGKSTLMSKIYNTISTDSAQGTSPENNIYLEFFFNARGAPLERSALGMLRTLSNQLFIHDPDSRTLLRTRYKEKQASFGNIGWDWQQPELQELLSCMILTSASRRQIIIFVDALDEAGEATEDIAHYFYTLNKDIQEQSCKARICISCRHYPILSTAQALGEIHVENHNRGDIAAFIRDRIEHLIDVNQQSSNNAAEYEKWQKLIQELAVMANGLFQWARLVMSLVAKRINEGESVDEIQLWSIRIPTQLEEVYKYIIEKVIEQEYKTKSLQLFKWVCLATQPLSISELRYILARQDVVANSLPQAVGHEPLNLTPSDELMRRRIISWSGGLIEVVDNGNRPWSGNRATVVQPVHLSVKTFLLTQGLQLLVQSSRNHETYQVKLTHGVGHGLSVAMCHGELYWSCLKRIAAGKEKPFLLRLDGQVVSDVWWKMEEECPFIQYALHNVLVHAEQAQNQRGQDLEQELQLLEHALPLWAAIWDANQGGELLCTGPRPLRIHQGSKPLHIAAAANMTDLAAYLLEHGADVSMRDEWHQTALHLATWSGHLAMVKLLVEAAADIDARMLSGYTPLYLAAQVGNLDLFSWLLERGASLDPSSGGSASTLYAAAESGSIPIISLCLKASAGMSCERKWLENALYVAAEQGYAESTQMLIEAGADVNAEGGEYGTALQAAAHKGNAEIVQTLLEAGGDVNIEAGSHGTALQGASRGRKKKIVRALLDAGAKVNLRSGQYGTALQGAALKSSHDLSILHILLEAGADVSVKGGRFGTALQAAVMGRSLGAVQALIKVGADVNAEGGEYGTALQAAAYLGRPEIVQTLLEAGASVNAANGRHGTALQAAARSSSVYNINTREYEKKVTLLQILLKAGADINAEGGPHGSALQAATSMKNLEAVQLLVDAGADINAEGGEDSSALDGSVRAEDTKVLQMLLQARANVDVNAKRGRDGSVLLEGWMELESGLNIVQSLLGAGADVNFRSEDLETILQWAAYRGNMDVVQALLKAGVDVNAQSDRFGDVLHAAASQGNVEVMRFLLGQGMEVNAQGGTYGTALQAAAYQGSYGAVQTLLQAGADVNAKGGQYSSALQATAASGSLRDTTDIVQMLVERGASVNAKGGEYGTALQAAAHKNKIKVMRLLLDKGANVNIQGGEYDTALQAAACSTCKRVSRESPLLNRSIEMVQMFLEAGADIDAEGGKYNNVLQAAAGSRSENSEDKVQILLNLGVDVNAQGGYFGNALQAAAFTCSVKIVRMLLEAEANINAEGGKYGNALQAAAADEVISRLRHSENVVRILLDAGANINAQGGHFGDALQAAASAGNVKVVKMLLEAGADANAVGGHYSSALHAAAAAAVKMDHPSNLWRMLDVMDVVRMLLDAGACVKAQGGDFSAAISAARKTGCHELAEMLMQAGIEVEGDA